MLFRFVKGFICGIERGYWVIKKSLLHLELRGHFAILSLYCLLSWNCTNLKTVWTKSAKSLWACSESTEVIYHTIHINRSPLCSDLYSLYDRISCRCSLRTVRDLSELYENLMNHWRKWQLWGENAISVCSQRALRRVVLGKVSPLQRIFGVIAIYFLELL